MSVILHPSSLKMSKSKFRKGKNVMKSLLERIEGINFKKAFVAFGVVFLVFVAAYFSYMASSGRWSAALNFERNRMEIMRGNLTEYEAGAMRERLGHFNRGRPERMHRSPGDRFLHRTARVWNRITSTEFGMFYLFGRLFRVAFNVLLALWVYADSRKHGKNKIFWPVLTLFTSIIGWLIYMIVRENRGYMPQTANEA